MSTSSSLPLFFIVTTLQIVFFSPHFFFRTYLPTFTLLHLSNNILKNKNTILFDLNIYIYFFFLILLHYILQNKNYLIKIIINNNNLKIKNLKKFAKIFLKHSFFRFFFLSISYFVVVFVVVTPRFSNFFGINAKFVIKVHKFLYFKFFCFFLLEI